MTIAQIDVGFYVRSRDHFGRRLRHRARGLGVKNKYSLMGGLAFVGRNDFLLNWRWARRCIGV
jgi:hypothetical protein